MNGNNGNNRGNRDNKDNRDSRDNGHNGYDGYDVYNGYVRLNEAFQYVDDRFLDIVEQQRKVRKRKSAWAILGAVAASICMLLLLPFGVMANNWFGLKDLLLSGHNLEPVSITLADYRESPEAKALAEWEEFLEDYDKDGKILSEVGDGIFAVEGREDWSLYGIYSMEMGEKLDEIVSKHGLRLHTEKCSISPVELEAQLGGNLMEEIRQGDCYLYEDGSFCFESGAELDGQESIEFQFICVAKGVFDEAMRSIGQADYDREWQHASACGKPVLLAMGKSAALVLTELGDCFAALTTSFGSEDGMTKEKLQELANKVDFRILEDEQASDVPNAPNASNASEMGSFGKSDMSMIALSGYMDGAEAKALAEWEDFLAHYDTDHKIAGEIGNDIFFVEGREDWFLYHVYSYEMGEKLDEIVGKHGLKLRKEINVISAEELEYRVGGSFLAKDCDKCWAYMYEDGSFGTEGAAVLDGCGTVDFQFRRVVKGFFDEVTLSIGQVDDYKEWQYITACGEQVLLALGPYKALIFGDFEECFLAVNVLCGREDGMTEKNLQELADKIDFRVLKDVKIPEMRGDSDA